MARVVRRSLLAGTVLALALTGMSAPALERLDFSVTGADRALEREVRAASGLLAAQAGKRTDALDLFADARAEYGRLLAALYAAGHYGPEIHVRIDGREAAEIPALDAPGQIGVIEVTVDPGPAFAFGATRIAPLAPGTDLPDGFALGRPAESGLVIEAVQAAVDGWRAKGHAKAAPGRQGLVADHPNSTLSADIEMSPGPVLRFGALRVSGNERLRTERAHAIAGLPEGERFDPVELRRVAERLRRSGVFSSVTVSEDEAITRPDLLGISAELVEARPRRYTFGAELASQDGLVLSGSWLHRNLLGGAERLEIGFDISGIAAQSGGADYAIGVRLDRPATPDPDTVLNLGLDLAQVNDADAHTGLFGARAGFTHYFTESFQAQAGLGYAALFGRDAAGKFAYRTAELPLGLTWDRRDSKIDPTELFYLDLGVKPFYGFGATDNGAQLTFDARGYRSLGEEDRVVLALRLQGGAVLGSEILNTPRDDLFFSGGGGTVRGMPYQSLGVTVDDGGTPVTMGGNRFLAGSLEARVKLAGRFGLAAFVDAGLVGNGSDSDWHAGAGLGLRYATGIGPVRLDLAAPVRGDGKGLQVYVGLGQAF